MPLPLDHLRLEVVLLVGICQDQRGWRIVGPFHGSEVFWCMFENGRGEIGATDTVESVSEVEGCVVFEVSGRPSADAVIVVRVYVSWPGRMSDELRLYVAARLLP